MTRNFTHIPFDQSNLFRHFFILGCIFLHFQCNTLSAQIYETITISGTLPCKGYHANATYYGSLQSNGDPRYSRLGRIIHKFTTYWAITNISVGILFRNYDVSGSDVPLTGWIHDEVNGCPENPLPIFSVVLPVKLVDFNANLYSDRTELQWTTAAEINNQGFQIEWKQEGQEFETIGWVDGHGDTREEIQYRFVHPSPKNGNNYYRLKQIDYDGKYEYSEIKNVLLSKGDITIYPNPLTEKLYIKGIESGQYSIRNIMGQVIQEGFISGPFIDIEFLTQGQYMVSFWQGGHIQKHLIQKM